MTTILIAFAVAFFVSLVATRLAIPLAFRLRMLDVPDGVRKTHDLPTPRFGGPGLFAGFAVPLVLILLFRDLTQVSRVVIGNQGRLRDLLLTASLALILGVLDDRFNLRPRWKLLGQVVIGLAAYAAGFQIHGISTPWSGPLDLGVFALPVTLCWFVGCMNAVNLLDGLAAGTCLFAGLCLFLVSLHFGNVFGMLVMGCLSGATLGFLVFNFPPARIFLGDGGSLLLGYGVAALSLIGSSRKAEAAVALFIPVVALGLPITDTLVAIVRRWYKRLPLSTPDRAHIHHTLVAMGYSKRRAVLTLYLASIALGAAALVITMGRNEVILPVMGSLALITFVAIRVFSGVRVADVLRKLGADAERRAFRIRAEHAETRALERIRAAGDREALWAALCEACESLGLDAVHLAWPSRGAEPAEARSWRRAGAPASEAGDAWSFRLALDTGSGRPGHVAVERHADPDGEASEAGPVLCALRAGLLARAAELERP